MPVESFLRSSRRCSSFSRGGDLPRRSGTGPTVGGSVGRLAVSADIADGRSQANGVLAGIAIRPWLDLEGEIVFPGQPATRTYGGDVLTETFPRRRAHLRRSVNGWASSPASTANVISLPRFPGS